MFKKESLCFDSKPDDGYNEIIIDSHDKLYDQFNIFVGSQYIKSLNNEETDLKFNKAIKYVVEYKDDDKHILSQFNKRIEFKCNDVKFYIKNINYMDELAHTHYKVFIYNIMIIGYPETYNIAAFIKKIYDNEYVLSKIAIYNNEGAYWDKKTDLYTRPLSNVFIPKKELTNLIEKIDTFLHVKTAKLYELLGLKLKLTVLFAGVPGSGKSTLINAIASKYNKHICKLNYQKTRDSDLVELGTSLIKNSILTMEELDSTIYDKTEPNDTQITFAGLLSFLDGIYVPDGTIIFITTNHIEKFDPALIRHGRIDYVMTFNYATNEQIGDMFVRYMSFNPDLMEFSAETPELLEYKKIFIAKFSELKINITCSLLQQYLIPYIGNAKSAIDNIHKIKLMYDDLPKDDGHKSLYS